MIKTGNVRDILGRKCTAWLTTNQKTRSPSLSANSNFELKRMTLSVLGNLITVPLHLSSAVNNLSLKVVL